MLPLKSLICVIILAFGLICVQNIAQAQPIRLPTDLIFTASELGKPTQLMRVIAQTLEVVPFYSDPLAREDGLRAIKWSPNGQLLAILRLEDNDTSASFGVYRRLCILRLNGTLQVCTSEEAVVQRNQNGESQIDSLTWSEDSQSIFYVSSLSDKTTIRLIEASITTGQTVRVLFEHPRRGDYAPPLLVWHLPNLLVLGASFEQAPEYPLPFQQRSLLAQSDERRDLYPLLPTFGRLCPIISPKGNYYIVMSGILGADTLYIFNYRGRVVERLSSTADFPNLLFSSCPSWRSDEQELYFAASTSTTPSPYLFRYRFAERRISARYFVPAKTLRKADIEYYSGGPFQVSPDGQYIAGFNSLKGYIVVYPPTETGDIIFFGNYSLVYAPLWVPPLP